MTEFTLTPKEEQYRQDLGLTMEDVKWNGINGLCSTFGLACIQQTKNDAILGHYLRDQMTTKESVTANTLSEEYWETACTLDSENRRPNWDEVEGSEAEALKRRAHEKIHWKIQEHGARCAIRILGEDAVQTLIQNSKSKSDRSVALLKEHDLPHLARFFTPTPKR